MVFVILHSPGVMADGNWSQATYIDQRADDEQTAALTAIFTAPPVAPWPRSSP
ncbi:MAG: DUF1326 domain-containing protein [Aliidongia sp.]